MFILIKADENGVSSIETIDKMKMELNDYYNAIGCNCINIHPCGPRRHEQSPSRG